jgi:hypothetical protein
MARAISKVQAAYGRLDHHFAHATGIDVVHETTDAVPVREKRMAAHARDGCAHRIVEVVERTELVRRRMARRAASSPRASALGVVHEHHFACAQKAL